MKCSSGVTQASKNRSFTREGGLSERAEAQCDVPARTKQTNKIEKLSVVVRQLLAACSMQQGWDCNAIPLQVQVASTHSPR